ncbi:MAG: D-glycero-beta-D-manno-heptose-7-phosphate kinase [Acidobacteria bacterium]|nr:D-glycero-beta-D-manno-heptose-7-phosphate kinase [Acidobacteriota bacterium]
MMRKSVQDETNKGVVMIDPGKLETIVSRFGDSKIGVIGDLMLDRFIWGKVSRISPEAPVPVVQVTHETVHLGGAANVVANITAMGGTAVPIGLVGSDEVGRSLTQLIKAQGADSKFVVSGEDFISIQKTRIIAHHQQVCRVDREGVATLTQRDRESLLQRIEPFLQEVDLLVVSDYGKGVIDADLLGVLRQSSTDHEVLIDPKDRNFNHYYGFTAMTPNQGEAERMSGITFDDEDAVNRAAAKIFENQAPKLLLITRGENGMTLFDGPGVRLDIPTQAREVYDVSGAGDTVIATFACARQAGATGYEAAILANMAAGIVVGKLGTASTDQSELVQAIRAQFNG